MKDLIQNKTLKTYQRQYVVFSTTEDNSQASLLRREGMLFGSHVELSDCCIISSNTGVIIGLYSLNNVTYKVSTQA